TMILIKITKENREPEVGEWCKYYKIEDDWDLELNPGLKALSLSVILDAPHWLLDSDWEKNHNKEAFQAYPISNSEEIFQWLHDQGKLGEEWVEWEGDHLFDWDDAVILRGTDKCTCPATSTEPAIVDNTVLPAVLRPKMGGEALKLLKEGKTIEVENEFVFDLMRFVERKESNFIFTCRVNKLNQGWTVIEHGS